VITRYIPTTGAKVQRESDKPKKVPVRRGGTFLSGNRPVLERWVGGDYAGNDLPENYFIKDGYICIDHADPGRMSRVDETEIRISEDYDLTAHPLPSWCELVELPDDRAQREEVEADHKHSCVKCHRVPTNELDDLVDTPEGPVCAQCYLDKPAPKFQVGMKVRFVKALRGPSGPFKPGQILTLEKPESHKGRQGWTVEESFKYAVYEDEIKPAQDEWSPAVGDWVEVSGYDMGIGEGLVGKVNNTSTRKGWVGIDAGGTGRQFPAQNLKPHTPACKTCQHLNGVTCTGPGANGRRVPDCRDNNWANYKPVIHLKPVTKK
jgi:hypothetical protein